ncbi:hypothetical protein ACTA71_008817 [Dictyostelium dimigraforme]
MNRGHLPLILIKKIIMHLIRFKKKNVSKFFFLSKSIQRFIIKQIEVLSFEGIRPFEQFIDSKNEINDQITEIKIKMIRFNEILSNPNIGDIFKSLKIIYLKCEKIKYILNNVVKSDGYLLKIKNLSNTGYELFSDDNLSIFERSKKIKLTCNIFGINNAKYLFKMPYLESIDIALSTTFYKTSFWLDGEDDDEIMRAHLEFRNSILEFQESTSTNSILKTLSLREPFYPYRTGICGRYGRSNYKIFMNRSIPSILSSPFSNISKFCLYGFLLPNEYSIFDYLSTTKIKKLKLVDVIGLDGNWSNFINYCQKNQSLKQLSIRGNSIEDKDNLFSNSVLKNHSTLSKLDISHNFFNLSLVIESILSKYYQFSKLTISDANILPFNLLLSNSDKLLSHYDEGGDSHLCIQYRIESKKKKVTLTPSSVQDLKKSFFTLLFNLEELLYIEDLIYIE